MKKIFTMTLMLAALLLMGCSSNDKNLLRALPEDTEILMRVDMKATATSMGYSWLELLSLAVKDTEDKEDTGIDFSGMAYAFGTESMDLCGIVMPVKDAEALRSYLTSQGMAVSETDGIFTVSGMLAFDKSRLVVATGSKASSFNLSSLLKQEGVDDDVTELCDILDQIDEPISIVVDGDIIKKNSARDFTTSMALATIPLDIEEIYVTVGIDPNEKGLTMTGLIQSNDSKAEDQLREMQKKLVPIKDGKIPFVADRYVGLLATNLRGSDLKQYASMFGGIETDALLDAINGLATLTITGIDTNTTIPSFTFTAQANKLDCLDALMENLSGFGIKIKNEGHHNWTVYSGTSEPLLIGAQGGYVFANYGNNMQRPKGDNTIDLEDGTVVYLHAFPSLVPGYESFGVEEVELYATDEMNMQLTITMNKTWKEVLKK